MPDTKWNSHYKKERSSLLYPDENLVRLLKKTGTDNNKDQVVADLGCGSGRHIRLLKDMGFSLIIGMDNSINALRLTQQFRPWGLLLGDNLALPFRSASIDLIIAWGSLHYSLKEDLPVMLEEIYRVLKNGGRCIATLRSSEDTYLKSGKHMGNDTWNTDLKDIKGSIVSFYTINEINRYFKKFFHFKCGKISRTPIGDINRNIAHWIIEAIKH